MHVQLITSNLRSYLIFFSLRSFFASDADSDCFGELVCYFRNAYEPVPGCSGQGGHGEDYCYHPMRHGVDGDAADWVPRITRSPTPAPTTAKPTPRPNIRGRLDHPERPREYALNDDHDQHSAEESGIVSVNRAHANPFEDGDRPLGGGEGVGTADPDIQAFELVRNHNCFVRQCHLCEGSCQGDSDCADGLFCIRRDEFGDDAVDNLADCNGEALDRANYCYHSRPHADLAIVPDAGANCGNGVICTVCQGDCDRDEECAGSLKCFQRSSFERVPGCGGRGIEGRDYCYKPDKEDEVEVDDEVELEIETAEDSPAVKPEHTLDPLIDEVEDIDDGLAHEKLPKLTEEHYYCQKVQCGVCEGDCNDSSDCSGDLVCIHREENEPMENLGCSGDGVKGMDYCVDQMRVNWKTARYDGRTRKWWALQ